MKLLVRTTQALRRSRFLAAALFVLVSTLGATPSTTPAWTLRYSFGTYLFGGTTFTVEANGRFRISASLGETRSLPNRRIDLEGTLPKDELSALAVLVRAASPGLWSSRYTESGCLDYGVDLTLTRRSPGGQNETTRTSWGCRLAGVPSDLRALLDAIRADVRARVPSALTDLENEESASDVHPSARIVLEDPGIASRRIVIDADGKIVSRARISKTLYPLAPCPERDLGRVSTSDLGRMRAMLVPRDDTINYATSVETKRVFSAAMSDCQTPSGWLSDEYVVPSNARWALQLSMSRSSGHSRLEIDSLGQAVAYAGTRDSPFFAFGVDAATLRTLDELVVAAKDASWRPGYFPIGTDCVDFVRIARLHGARSTDVGSELACGSSGIPSDLHALQRFLHDRFAAFTSDSHRLPTPLVSR